ncbi:MAG: sugar phosphate isomerase/epimerase family protein [Eubacteriales bacterium]
MNLAISGQALAPVKTIDEIIKIIKNFQVYNIELWTVNIPIKKDVKQANGITGRDIEYIKILLESEKIIPACLTFGGAFNPAFFNGNSEVYTGELIETIKTAKYIGAETVNHYCYFISKDKTPDFERLKAFLSPAIEEAEKLGITLALENEAHDSTATPEGMLEIIELFNSPFFKTNFDATNYYHASCEGFPYAYNLLKKHIAYVHIKNGCIYNDKLNYHSHSIGSPMSGANAGHSIYYPTINEGAVNIDGLLSCLKKDNYNGFITLEPHTTPDNVESYYKTEVEYLRSRYNC